MELPLQGAASALTRDAAAASSVVTTPDATRPPFRPTPVLQGLRVLVVEDEPASRSVLQWLLEQCGA